MAKLKITKQQFEDIVKKRKWYEGGKHYFIDIKNKRVVLNSDFYSQLLNNKLWGHSGFKKIGGSSIGSMVGLNSFDTPFKSSIDIMRLGMPMYDPKYVAAGDALEPKVVEIMSVKKGRPIKRYVAADYDYDYFATIDYFKNNPTLSENFQGVPDAYDDEDKTLYELKTTGLKNKSKWDNEGVPKYYQLQAALYKYIMKADRVKIVACFLEPEDYAKPENVNVIEKMENKLIKSYDIEITEKELKEYMWQAIEFRNKIVLSGMSLNYDEEADVELLGYLRCQDQYQYRDWLLKNKFIVEGL